MHARDLVEVAVVVVTQAEAFFAETSQHPDPTSLWSRYWTISRCRLDRWHRKLPSALNTQTSRSTAEEILTSEILTRVWTALLSLAPHTSTTECEPIARNIYLAHQEARNKVLKLFSHPEHLSETDAIVLNRLRRRCERWTDLLLAYLSQYGSVDEFAFDVDRMHDFAEDLHDDGVFEGRGDSWLLLLASLRNAFQQGYASAGANADLNKQLATLIMRCVPAREMEEVELPRSMWQIRIERLACETEGLVAELFELDELMHVATGPLRLERRRPSGGL